MSELEIADIFLILLIISFFTVIQSLFGVGLLVFGTPTLLLMGYDFIEALTYLLPSSFVISLCQVYPNQHFLDRYKFDVFIFLLPMLVVGLLLIMHTSWISLNFFIGLILLFTFLSRFFTSIELVLGHFLSKYYRLGLSIIGFIHGMTNLGGAPLLILTNGLYDNKKRIQINVAYAYLLMALVQIIVLFLNGSFAVDFLFLSSPLISVGIFLFLGRRVFDSTSEIFYRNLMTFFILIYGLLLVSQSF